MRCYNGCPDKEYQALLDGRALARKRLAVIGLRDTYFPLEGMYMVFDSNFLPFGPFHPSLTDAAEAAIDKARRAA